MGYKVAVLHQGFVPTYRKPFFELLNRTSESDYVVFHGDPPTGSGWTAAAGPYDFPNVKVTNREIPIARWRAIWQPVVREIATGGYDAVVMGHEVKFLSNLALAGLFRLRRRPVLLWGFGFHVKMGVGFTSEASGLRARISGAVKDRIARSADGYLAYTERGAEALKRIGLPQRKVWVVRNTIDIAQQCRHYDALADADDQALRRELDLRPDSAVLLFVGRLLEAKKGDEAVEAVRRLNQAGGTRRFVELVVIGGGPILGDLKQRYGDVPGVRFLGELFDQERVARYMRVASALVIPGYVGLAVNHAFAQGLPVITRAHELHSPEIEYVEHGRNGLIVPGGFDAFVAELGRLVDDPAALDALAAGALATRESLRLETMVERFDEAVTRTIERQRHRPMPASDRQAGAAGTE